MESTEHHWSRGGAYERIRSNLKIGKHVPLRSEEKWYRYIETFGRVCRSIGFQAANDVQRYR